MIHVFYNPLADNRHGKSNIKRIEPFFEGKKLLYEDITKIDDMDACLRKFPDEEEIIIAGGDGTLSRFANAIREDLLDRPLYYFPIGSGNDFMTDICGKGVLKPIPLRSYLKDLPTVTVDGHAYRYLNGVGFGLDGYVCEIGNRQRAEDSHRRINYTAIALKGLLYDYQNAAATVTVDGVEHHYTNVLMTPTMNGRYFGGGMKVAPDQDRLNAGHTISVIVVHGLSRAKTILLFPQIFRGTHTKNTAYVDVLTGQEITIAYDRPIPLQIDGETLQSVASCTCRSAAVRAEAPV